MPTSRSRTRSSMEPTTLTQVATYPGTNWPPVITVTHPSTQGVASTMSDNNNKGFRPGAICMSDCSLFKIERAVTSGEIHYDYGPTAIYHWKASGDLTAWIPAFPEYAQLSPKNLEGESLIKAYAKMNAKSVNTAENLNDFASTVRMLRSPFSASRDLVKKITKSYSRQLKSLRAGGFSRRKARAKAFSEAWLEYSYGWRPIFMDMDEIAQIILQKRASMVGQRLVARAGGTLRDSVSGIFEPTLVSGKYGREGTYSQKVEKRVSAGVLYEVVDASADRNLGSLLRLDARDVPATLWAVLPYSFVVDQFVGVEDWLQAIMPVSGIRILGNWVTTVLTSDSEASMTAFPAEWGTYPIWSGSYGGFREKTIQYTRIVNQPLPSLPVPTLSLNWAHLVSDVSLLVSGLVKDLGQLGRYR